jgi:hypothetical protein
MNPKRMVTVILISFPIELRASGVTSDQLANFLNIQSWETSLPSRSFTVEILQIEDGEAGKSVLQCPKGLIDGDFGILIGMSGSEYKVMITWGASSLSMYSSLPEFKRGSFSPPIPARVQAGDYVLFGEPKRSLRSLDAEELKNKQNDASFYARGFLLRVKQM